MIPVLATCFVPAHILGAIKPLGRVDIMAKVICISCSFA